MKIDFDTVMKNWKPLSSDEKVPVYLALAMFIFLFMPWISISYEWASFSMNGFRRAGYLTFLGVLGFLALRVIVLSGNTNFKLGELNVKTQEKILAGIIAAGPVLWLLDARFEFSVLGFGFWLTLIAVALFVYLVFTGKKFSELQHSAEDIAKKMGSGKK